MSHDFRAPRTRRSFLTEGLGIVSLATTAPWFLDLTARGMALPQETGGLPKATGDIANRILVVVQLGGGNDGLNTVVPFGDGGYYDARPQLSIPEPGKAGGCLPLSGTTGLGLHPAMSDLASLFDDGRVTIVQGVGYPNPNRSHFTSMDIWHTARNNAGGDGWIGRYFDCTCNGKPVQDGAIAIGQSPPLAMQGVVQAPVAFEDAQLFQWLGRNIDRSLEEPYQEIMRAGVRPGVAPDSHAAFLARTVLDAQLSSDRVRRALGRESLVSYPGSGLGRQMQSIGAIIRDGLSTRVYYAAISGFDTHAGQGPTQERLLGEFAAAMRAFQSDLDAQGNADRVMVMVFSEFGRRVGQNASQGTDHGTAAPLFLVGSSVRAGVLGQHPSLVDLDQGDLKFSVDFRSVYAGVLSDWMGADAVTILGKSYPPAKVVAKERRAART